MNLARPLELFLLSSFLLAAPIRGYSQETQSRLPFEGTKNSLSTLADVDILCILSTWRVKGVLVCTHGVDVDVCLWTENAYPTGIIEVVRQPYRSHYIEFVPQLSILGGLDLGARSSAKSSNAGAGDSLQFAEVHAANWVPELGLDSMELLAIPEDQTLAQLVYASEIDLLWRNPLLALLTSPRSALTSLRSCERFPNIRDCAWRWGSYHPMIGALSHPSEVMAAVMQSLRGGRAAASAFARVTLGGNYRFEPRTGHYIQRISPLRMPSCVSIGSPLAIPLIERGGGSPHGAYAWLIYSIVEECDG